MESGIEEICANCKKTAKEAKLEKLRRCTQCKSASFCGSSCQKNNFSYHRSLCQKIKQVEAELQREESKYESLNESEKKSSSGTDLLDLIHNLKYYLARMVLTFANDKKAYQRVNYYLKDVKDNSDKETLPWKSFMYMLIDEDEKSYKIIQDVLKEKGISIAANKTIKDDLRTEFCLFYKKFEEKREIFDEEYAWILMALKYKLLQGIFSNENQWRKMYTKFEKAHEDSKSAEFYRSDRLMACLESFIKGNPSKFEQRKEDLKAEIQYYYLDMIHNHTPQKVMQSGENLQAEKSNHPDSLKECQEYRENLTSQLLKKYFSRQGAELKNYIENFEKNLLKKDEELGMPIHEDISKFVAKLMKRIPMIPDDTIKEWQLEMQQTREFVLAHPWPNFQSITKFIRKNAKIRGEFEKLDIKGAEFYNHDLAKELWDSGTILDYVERMKKYRTIGWKIKVHADSLITESENKLTKNLNTFFYLHQHVMCGQGIFPAKVIKGKQNKPKGLFGVSALIDEAWDQVGPWVTGQARLELK